MHPQEIYEYELYCLRRKLGKLSASTLCEATQLRRLLRWPVTTEPPERMRRPGSRVFVQLKPGMQKRLRQTAAAERTTVSAIMKRALQAYITEWQNSGATT